jgi:alpha-tubulin suppressor-like RCC1 family protein
MGDDIHRDDPALIQSLAQYKIKQFSAGFQHCMFLNEKGFAFGIGKNTRY